MLSSNVNGCRGVIKRSRRHSGVFEALDRGLRVTIRSNGCSGFYWGLGHLDLNASISGTCRCDAVRQVVLAVTSISAVCSGLLTRVGSGTRDVRA